MEYKIFYLEQSNDNNISSQPSPRLSLTHKIDPDLFVLTISFSFFISFVVEPEPGLIPCVLWRANII